MTYKLTYAWFPALRIRCRSRFRKNRVRTGRCCWGVCVATAWQAQEPGRRVSSAEEWAELQACTNGRYGKIELDPIWTATANLRKRRTLFLRKLRSSYRILTDERNFYILCYSYSYHTETDTECWKWGISRYCWVVLICREISIVLNSLSVIGNIAF